VALLVRVVLADDLLGRIGQVLQVERRLVPGRGERFVAPHRQERALRPVGGHGGERLDEEALDVRAHVGLLAELPQLLAEIVHMALVVALERAELRRDVLVVARLDRLLVSLDRVHVEVDQVLHCADRGHLRSPFALSESWIGPAAPRPLSSGCPARSDGLQPAGRKTGSRPWNPPAERSRPADPSFLVPRVPRRLLLTLAQLFLVDVADVAEARSPRAVLAPVHAAPHVQLVPRRPVPGAGGGSELPPGAGGDFTGELGHEAVEKRR